MNPVTGYFRDGCCRTDETDQGMHTLCARVTDAFLEFSLQQGNDLITPRPETGFEGLKAGDNWCVCVTRWIEAYEAAAAPPVVLESTHESVLKHIPLEVLQDFAVENMPVVAPAARKPQLRLVMGGLAGR